MTISFKYKGRSFSSAKSLADAVQRDIQQAYEQKLRRAASSSGTHIRKTSRGFEIEGDTNQMGRFYDRLGK